MITTTTSSSSSLDDATATSRTAGLAADTLVLTRRAVRHQVRQVDGVIMSMVLPVMLLLVFVYVLGGAITDRDAYLHYVVPGVIVLAAGYSAAQVAQAVVEDLASGTVDRLRSMATSSAALLSGHVLANVVRNLGSTLLVTALVVAMGYRPVASPGAWLGAAGTAVLYMLAIATVSAVIGIAARSVDGASGFTFFVLFLPYVSSGFVEPETLPAALRGFAEHQPITPVVETMRALLLGTDVGSNGVLAVLWCVTLIGLRRSPGRLAVPSQDLLWDLTRGCSAMVTHQGQRSRRPRPRRTAYRLSTFLPGRSRSARRWEGGGPARGPTGASRAGVPYSASTHSRR